MKILVICGLTLVLFERMRAHCELLFNWGSVVLNCTVYRKQPQEMADTRHPTSESLALKH